MAEKRKYGKSKDQNNPGPQNELRVINSIPILQRINHLVVGCHHSKKNGEIDGMGFDVTIFLRNGFSLFVQVKSSNKKLKDHFDKYPHTLVIIVSPNMPSEKIAELLSNIINDFGKRFFDKVVDDSDVYPEYRRHKVAVET